MIMWTFSYTNWLIFVWITWYRAYLRPLTPQIMPSYTHKMAIVSWPQILRRHFTLCIAVRKVATPLRELAATWDHTVLSATRQRWPALTSAVTGTRLSHPELMQGWDDLLAGYIPRWYTRPKTVPHPSTNRARRGLTSFMRRTPLTTTSRLHLHRIF